MARIHPFPERGINSYTAALSTGEQKRNEFSSPARQAIEKELENQTRRRFSGPFIPAPAPPTILLPSSSGAEHEHGRDRSAGHPGTPPDARETSGRSGRTSGPQRAADRPWRRCSGLPGASARAAGGGPSKGGAALDLRHRPCRRPRHARMRAYRLVPASQASHRAGAPQGSARSLELRSRPPHRARRSPRPSRAGSRSGRCRAVPQRRPCTARTGGKLTGEAQGPAHPGGAFTAPPFGADERTMPERPAFLRHDRDRRRAAFPGSPPNGRLRAGPPARTTCPCACARAPSAWPAWSARWHSWGRPSGSSPPGPISRGIVPASCRNESSDVSSAI